MRYCKNLTNMVVAIILPFSAAAIATTSAFFGNVTSVHDGDTLSVLTMEGKKLTIRLSDIDAPELAQPFGPEARAQLARLVLSKRVTLVVSGLDIYGRQIARVTVDGIDVNKSLVRLGYAWSARQYTKDADVIKAELNARIARVGLWSLPRPQAPWDWRDRPQNPQVGKADVAQTQTKVPASAIDAAASAGDKRMQQQVAAYLGGTPDFFVGRPKQESKLILQADKANRLDFGYDYSASQRVVWAGFAESTDFTGSVTTYNPNKIYTGPRGGKYHFTETGNKQYESTNRKKP